MCTNYLPTARDRFKAAQLGVSHLPESEWPPEVFPGYIAPIVLMGSKSSELAQVPEVQLARFGLIPRWSRDTAHANALARHTYNARIETVAEKPSFRSAWRARQWALVPMMSYFEYCFESARPVRWRISQTNSKPFFCAGLWECWQDPSNASNAPNSLISAANADCHTSFTLLTVNADQHPVASRMHRPGDEKRMPLIVDGDRLGDWLSATLNDAAQLVRINARVDLTAEAAPKVASNPLVSSPYPTTGNLF